MWSISKVPHTPSSMYSGNSYTPRSDFEADTQAGSGSGSGSSALSCCSESSEFEQFDWQTSADIGDGEPLPPWAAAAFDSFQTPGRDKTVSRLDNSIMRQQNALRKAPWCPSLQQSAGVTALRNGTPLRKAPSFNPDENYENFVTNARTPLHNGPSFNASTPCQQATPLCKAPAFNAKTPFQAIQESRRRKAPWVTQRPPQMLGPPQILPQTWAAPQRPPQMLGPPILEPPPQMLGPTGPIGTTGLRYNAKKKICDVIEDALGQRLCDITMSDWTTYTNVEVIVPPLKSEMYDPWNMDPAAPARVLTSVMNAYNSDGSPHIKAVLPSADQPKLTIKYCDAHDDEQCWDFAEKGHCPRVHLGQCRWKHAALEVFIISVVMEPLQYTEDERVPQGSNVQQAAGNVQQINPAGGMAVPMVTYSATSPSWECTSVDQGLCMTCVPDAAPMPYIPVPDSATCVSHTVTDSAMRAAAYAHAIQHGGEMVDIKLGYAEMPSGGTEKSTFAATPRDSSEPSTSTTTPRDSSENGSSSEATPQDSSEKRSQSSEADFVSPTGSASRSNSKRWADIESDDEFCFNLT